MHGARRNYRYDWDVSTTHGTSGRRPYGDGGASGGESSLRQGVGTASPGSPDLKTAAVAEQQRDRQKGSSFEGFRTRAKYRRKGAARGAPGVQAPLGTAPP